MELKTMRIKESHSRPFLQSFAFLTMIVFYSACRCSVFFIEKRRHQPSERVLWLSRMVVSLTVDLPSSGAHFIVHSPASDSICIGSTRCSLKDSFKEEPCTSLGREGSSQSIGRESSSLVIGRDSSSLNCCSIGVA
uniref:Uncharacterized protein n=1 Tax=Salix viminalis TaxID=40686 RepID=A0A6N2KLK0_SALVM